MERQREGRKTIVNTSTDAEDEACCIEEAPLKSKRELSNNGFSDPNTNNQNDSNFLTASKRIIFKLTYFKQG